MEIKIVKKVLGANDEIAGRIRQRLADQKTIMLNLISSPGSGKTALLEKTLQHFQGQARIAVIEGDVATDKDARRLQQFDFPIALINTEGGCHLTAPSIEHALDELGAERYDLIFIENVGNLVCPSAFDLGEQAKIAIVSTAEGDDKPAKYPLLFRQAQLVILNKIDLLPYLDFNSARFYQELRQINAGIPIIETSCTSGQGLDVWVDWLRSLQAR